MAKEFGMDEKLAQTLSVLARDANKVLKMNLPPILRDMRRVYKTAASSDQTPVQRKLRAQMIEDPVGFVQQLQGLEKAWMVQEKAVKTLLAEKWAELADAIRSILAPATPPSSPTSVPESSPASAPPEPPPPDPGAERLSDVMDRLLSRSS